MDKIKTWLKKNWFLVLILAVGAYLRLYRIGDYMTFLGDEGRDAIIVRRLLTNFDPILIGPGTSIGSMYLGPLYYYLIAPSLFLANFSPVGPSVFVALVGVATIWFVYHVGREWFPSTGSLRGDSVEPGPSAAGLVAAALYAISPIVIIYSRSSWNPNVMPFFALLSIYSIWKVWREKKYKWLIILGISYAFVLQSHYLGLLLAPVLAIFWYLSRAPIRYSLIAVSLFAFLMSPLVIFDARHGWNNFAAMKKFFAERQTTVSARPWSAIPKIYPISQDANTSLLTAKNIVVGRWLTIAMVVMVIWLIVKKKITIQPSSPLAILFSWLVFGLLGLGLYKQQIYDHYYGFMFPAIFLLIGFLLSQFNKWLMLLATCYLLLLNLASLPIKSPPNMQMRRAIEVSGKIAEESGGKLFNIAVVAERNYEDGYQYFLEKDGNPVVEIDAQIPETVTDQLFVICEMVPEKCDPTHSSKAEVANFGWSKIESEWEVYGVRLYKLVHTQ